MRDDDGVVPRSRAHRLGWDHMLIQIFSALDPLWPLRLIHTIAGQMEIIQILLNFQRLI
jgi:hypothetical protein